MSATKHNRPEPNFYRLPTPQDLDRLEISAHALRRFAERLQPNIPGADRVASDMAALEDLGSGNRTGPQQGQLNRYRDWMARYVEPHVRDLIACEGFWASERPRWSMSRTRSDRYLQIARICLFPVIEDVGRLVATTCTNGRDTTWDTALARGYTLTPKPFTAIAPIPLKPPRRRALIAQTWRARHDHGGLRTAYREARADAIEATRKYNAEREATFEAAKADWLTQREHAAQTFHARHPAP
jgi:hypothetical protein